MKKLFALSFVIAVLSISHILAHEIVAGPYLQDATPTSIHILWEQSEGHSSVVLWGRDQNLSNKADKVYAIVNHAPSQVCRVYLENLEPSTTYYYKVVVDKIESKMYHFTTPALASDEQPFQIVAMSDMQRDNAQPDKFKEIVEEGVIPYLEQENSSGNPFEDLEMVIIAGDLVNDGLRYTDWTDDFFRQSESLFPFVPVYPVLGNHERNSDYYFNYFHLPDNGTPGYMEHWWYKDHGNVRIIGLNSNENYRIVEQLDWLDAVLKDAEHQENIDFVFAQLHHPHKSELWIVGELDYTGEVIHRLEQFSSRTGKPTIHFFGHTHGYSRGQSEDHTHLWVNVATAGGKIDHWGEYVQANYDEFSVSHSDYGFVLMQIEAGDNPRFRLVRVSRGNVEHPKDNEVNDIIEISRYNVKPETPVCLSPIKKEKVKVGEVILQAEAFKSSDSSQEHGESQWQVARIDNFTNPDITIRKNYEDWYGNKNLNEGIDLSRQVISGLAEDTNYFWRVRYRTKGLQWSDWSEVQEFSTK